MPLYSYKFNDMTLPDEDTYKVTIRMFMEFGLVQQYNIPYKVLCRWVLSVKKNYRPVSYHNWRHALNVCQTMFTVLRTGKMDRFMDDLEVHTSVPTSSSQCSKAQLTSGFVPIRLKLSFGILAK